MRTSHSLQDFSTCSRSVLMLCSFGSYTVNVHTCAYASVVFYDYRNKKHFSPGIKVISLGSVTFFARCWKVYFWGEKYMDINVHVIVTKTFLCCVAFFKQTLPLTLTVPSSKFFFFHSDSHADLLMSVLIIWWLYITTVSLSWWFSSTLSRACLIMYWSCNKKFHFDHFW